MGKTNATYRETFEHITQTWQPFRRALRRRDQQAFDALFVGAAQYNDAAGHQNHQAPMTSVLLSALLHHQRRIEELEERLPDDDGS